MDEEEVQERASPFARLEYEEWKRHQTPHLEAKENTSRGSSLSCWALS